MSATRDELLAKLIQINAGLREIERSLDDRDERIRKLEAAAAKAAEAEAMRKALEWYADRRRWHVVYDHRHGEGWFTVLEEGLTAVEPGGMHKQPWETARRALPLK